MERTRNALSTALILVVIAGLATDAYVHLHLARPFDGIRTSSLSQGDLFRVEAALAILAALALAVRPRLYTASIALLISAGGVVAVLLYAWVDVGRIGPVPDMYDPYWSTEKVLSLVGEAAAAAASLTLLVLMRRQARRPTEAAGRR